MEIFGEFFGKDQS